MRSSAVADERHTLAVEAQFLRILDQIRGGVGDVLRLFLDRVRGHEPVIDGGKGVALLQEVRVFYSHRTPFVAALPAAAVDEDDERRTGRLGFPVVELLQRVGAIAELLCPWREDRILEIGDALAQGFAELC